MLNPECLGLHNIRATIAHKISWHTDNTGNRLYILPMIQLLLHPLQQGSLFYEDYYNTHLSEVEDYEKCDKRNLAPPPRQQPHQFGQPLPFDPCHHSPDTKSLLQEFFVN